MEIHICMYVMYLFYLFSIEKRKREKEKELIKHSRKGVPLENYSH